MQAVVGDSYLAIDDIVTLLNEGLSNGDDPMQHAALLAAAKLLTDSDDAPLKRYQDALVTAHVLPALVRALKRTDVTSVYVAVLGNVLRMLAFHHPWNQTKMAAEGILLLVAKRLMRMGRSAGKRSPAFVEALGRLVENHNLNRGTIANMGVVEVLVAWLPVREPDEDYPDVVIAETLKLLMTEQNAAPDWADKGPLGFHASTQVLMLQFINADGLEALSRSRALLNSDLDPRCCQMLEWLWSFGGQEARRRVLEGGARGAAGERRPRSTHLVRRRRAGRRLPAAGRDRQQARPHARGGAGDQRHVAHDQPGRQGRPARKLPSAQQDLRDDR